MALTVTWSKINKNLYFIVLSFNIWKPSLNIINNQLKISVYIFFPSFISFLQLGLSPLLFCEDERENESSISASAAEQSPQKEIDGLYKHCTLQKGPLGFGFTLGYVPQSPRTFVSQVGMKYCIALN